MKQAAVRSVTAKHVKFIEELGFKVTLERVAPLKNSEIDKILKRDPGLAKLLRDLARGSTND
jgi:hypothetical protein